MLNRRFGRLVVVEEGPRGPQGKKQWRCRCDCGGTSQVREHNLLSGNSRSCGCQKRKGNRRTHGKSKTGLYGIWNHMLDRCRNPRCHNYSRYGGRGIRVCSRWRGEEGFQNFLDDMGEPGVGMTLDRRNNNGPYSPKNCRWASRTQQSQNRRTNRFLSLDGQRLCLAQWSRRVGISVLTIRGRLAAGWSVRKTLLTPLRGKKRNNYQVLLSKEEYRNGRLDPTGNGPG